MKTKKETLMYYLQNDYLNDQQIDFILALFDGGMTTKRDQLNFIFDSDINILNKIDTAYPVNIQTKVSELIGYSNVPSFAYSYNDNVSGLINVDKLFISKLIYLFAK